MQQNRGARWALAAIAATFAFVLFAVAGWAGSPQFGPTTASLAPNPVTGGTDVLYNVTFPYADQSTLTRSEIRITFPADWTYAGPADPNVCQPTGPTSLTCARGAVRSGDPPVTQAVRFKTGAVAATTPRTVSAILTFHEQASQGDSGRADFVAAPDATVDVAPPSDNHVSKCAAKGGETVSTKPGISETNLLTTTMKVPSTGSLCSPVSARELPPNDPSVDACPDGVECTTEIAITDAPLFTPANPVELIFDIYGKPKNWYKNGQLPAVGDCTGPPGTASPDPCISNRKNLAKGLRLTVLWSGDDPSWTG
jgi:hypothetical protein